MVLFVGLGFVFAARANLVLRGLAALDGTPATELTLEPAPLKLLAMVIIQGLMLGLRKLAVCYREHRLKGGGAGDIIWDGHSRPAA